MAETVALLGGGVIGGGWAARFVLNGFDVRLYDPDPDAERTVAAMVDNARRAYRRLTLAPLPREGAMTLVATPEDAVQDVSFVQESAPEREELKRGLLAAASRAAVPDAIFASSTSGLLPTRLQAAMTHPERFTVGHPFNPVYLLPLVELCGGERTAPETIDRAADVYRGLGMRPLIVRTEVDAFVADRLLEALWREALWLVAEDVATVAEVDDAIRFGAGLRWASMGSFLSYRIAGGEAGMRHFMEQFGPALELPWTKLTDVPELTEELLDKIVAQSDAQAGGRSIDELERLRDDCLVSVIHGLRSHDQGAGAVLAAYERALFAAAPAAPAAQDDAPLRLHTAVVQPEWIDYNGHAHESRYLQMFGDATDALLRHVGVDLDGGSSYFTVETHLSHVGEARAGERLGVTTQLLGHDEKRLHVFHSLHRSDDGALVATAEQMLLHVDTRAGRASAAAPELLERIARIAAAHAALPRPERAGRAVSDIAARTHRRTVRLSSARAMSSAKRESLHAMSNSTHTPTSISNLGVAMFTVADQDAALAFYTEKLGFEVRSDVSFGENGEMRWVEVAPPGSRSRLALNPPMNDTPGGSAIGVETSDVLGEHARLSAIGGIDIDAEPMRSPGAPLMFGLRDPDGNHIWVVETPPAA